MKPTVRLDHTLLAVESEHDVHAMIEIAVPEIADDASRAPLRLALVIDRSGSMAGEKLDVAKRCARWLASRLHPDDRLALVDYDDDVRLLAPLAPVDGGHQHAIDGIFAGGSTNLSGGWLKGLEQLRGGRGKILLLTDGLANAGVTDPAALAQLARSAAVEGIGTATVGLGAGFDEELLTAMADADGGNAHFAETPDAAPGIFAKELDGLMKLAAQNVGVEIRPREQVEVLGILNDYPQVAVPGGVQVQLGDAYGGERRRVVLALHVPRLAELGVATVADVVLRYVSVGDEIAAHEVEFPIVVNAVSAAEAAAAEPDAEVREQVLVLKAAHARDEAIRLADAGDTDAARLSLVSMASDLRVAGLAAEAGTLDDLLPSLERYDALSRKRMHFESHTRKRGR